MNSGSVMGLIRMLCVALLFVVSVGTVHGQEPTFAENETTLPVKRDTTRIEDPTIIPSSREMDGRPRVQDMITNIPGDWVASGEVAVESRSLPYLAGIGALTGLLVATDKQTDAWAKRVTLSSEAVRSSSRAIVRLGDGKTHLAIAAGFAAYGLLLNDSRAVRTGSQTVEALLSCGIAVQVLKRISGRESPAAATSSRGTWRCFPNLRTYQQHQSRYYAFPSGHISTAMATLTVIAENYPENHWIRPVGYSLLGFLGVSLVNVGYHWYSDFPLGIAMGYMFGMIAAHREDHLFAFLGNDAYSGLRVLPAVTQQGPGVSVALLF